MNATTKRNLKALAALMILVFAMYASSMHLRFRHGEGRFHPILWVLYCVKVFDPDRRLVVGRWFDTWSMGKQFLLFAQSAFIVIPSVLIVRKLNFQSGRLVRFAFSAASVFALSYPASYLFLFGHDTCRYIQRMGFTFNRIKGLFASGFYGAALVAFATWLLLSGGRKLELTERQKACLVNFCTGLSLFFCLIFLASLIHLWRHERYTFIWKSAQLICFPALLVVPFAIRFACTSQESPHVKWFKIIANGFGLFSILCSIG